MNTHTVFVYIHLSIMIVLLTILTAIISFPFSSALYNNASNHKGDMKMLTEDEWPSHGPWIVTVGTVY